MVLIGSFSGTSLLHWLLIMMGLCWTAESVGLYQQNNSMAFTSVSTSTSSPGSTSWYGGVREENNSTQQPTHQEKYFPRENYHHQKIVARPIQSANSRMLATNKHAERELIRTKIRLVPKDKLNRYKIEAARQLQASLIRSFQAIASSTQNIPTEVKAHAKRCLAAAQAGNYNPSIVQHLPTILQQGAQQQGQPARQLQTILSTLSPSVPPATGSSLKGLVDFISTNLSGVNNLLANVLGGVPDLLAGVIKSLTGNLGAVTGVLTGTLASLAELLGGVLG